MVTSAKELKQRLAAFLADPTQEEEFRTWFALMLRDAHRQSDTAVETLAHEVMWAFYDQKRGLCTSEELMAELTRLATADPVVRFGEPLYSVVTGSSTVPQPAAELVTGASQVDVGRASVYATAG